VNEKSCGGRGISRWQRLKRRTSDVLATADARSIPPHQPRERPPAAKRAAHAYYVPRFPPNLKTRFTTAVSGVQEIEAQAPSWCVPNSPTKRVGGPPADGFLPCVNASACSPEERLLKRKSCSLDGGC